MLILCCCAFIYRFSFSFILVGSWLLGVLSSLSICLVSSGSVDDRASFLVINRVLVYDGILRDLMFSFHRHLKEMTVFGLTCDWYFMLACGDS